MLIKTVRVTNPGNVLVQIPGYVVATWGLTTDSRLEVDFDENNEQVIIKPSVYGRKQATTRRNKVARAAAT